MVTANAVAPSPVPSTGAQYDPDAYDICRPAAPPPENETEAEKIDRLQREFDALRNCVNAELKVRTESSLLSMILLKVVLPFAAIAAGFSAIYIGMLRTGESQSAHAERFLGVGYLIIAVGAILLWRARRQRGSGGRGDSVDRAVRNALNLTVPPSKEKLTRNRYVNNWILFWMTWGLIIGLPLIFFIFRGNVLERAGLKLVFDSANVCAPIAGGFDPYEGSDVCKYSGYTYTNSRDVITSSETGLGAETDVDTLNVVPPRSVSEAKTAEVRIDVTTTLGLYFLILVGGIVVNMFRWFRRDKRRKRQIEQTAEIDAARGTV